RSTTLCKIVDLDRDLTAQTKIVDLGRVAHAQHAEDQTSCCYSSAPRGPCQPVPPGFRINLDRPAPSGTLHSTPTAGCQPVWWPAGAPLGNGTMVLPSGAGPEAVRKRLKFEKLWLTSARGCSTRVRARVM